MKKSISAILISVILVTFAFGTAFAKEEYRIKFGYSASDKEANIITFYNTFEKYVEEASGGRIAVDVYANAQLGGERQMLEGMTLGTIEMAMLSPGIAANIAPKFQVIDLPYLFNDRAAAYKALDGKLGQTLNDQILPKGVRLLCFPENGFRQITNNKAPLRESRSASSRFPPTWSSSRPSAPIRPPSTSANSTPPCFRRPSTRRKTP